MSLEESLKKVLIIDYGSQFTQLIARRIRELEVFCSIYPYNKITNKLGIDQILYKTLKIIEKQKNYPK